MPSSTPKFNLPYPVGSDPVADGDDAIRLLALALDGLFDGNSALYTTDASGNVAIPHALGRVPLTAIAVSSSNSGTGYLATVSAKTAATITVNMRNNTTGAVFVGAIGINWFVI